MRLGRRLSAGIAEDPPAPAAAEEPAVEEVLEDTDQREPAEQLVDR
ncbi:hypothetical protein [Actinomycetospora straminea]|uniref:Uncharacterized protein n=1 Tax=Actinomycetospora straminea TaxID=663607 RepID=A0ABP9EGN1_9PSEU|nr:hypothetical protein [Actinomycetospora straminea]MDD7933406.1 hypothetical protein [Actinomycetospora straminea]